MNSKLENLLYLITHGVEFIINGKGRLDSRNKIVYFKDKPVLDLIIHTDPNKSSLKSDYNFLIQSKNQNRLLRWDHNPINLGTFENLNIDAIKSIYKTATFGTKTETKIDKNVRSGHDIILENTYFYFKDSLANYDSLTNSFFYSDRLNYIKIHHFIDFNPLFNNDKVEVKPYKINIYEEGDFFVRHKDSLTNKNMIGTIVYCIYDDYEGGEFNIYHEDMKKTFSLKKDDWIFFYSNCDHEVLPITKGTRITISFKVFIKEKYEELTVLKKKNEINFEKIIEEFVSLINKRTIIPLSNSYADNFDPNFLIGSDKLLYDHLIKKFPDLKISNDYYYDDNDLLNLKKLDKKFISRYQDHCMVYEECHYDSSELMFLGEFDKNGGCKTCHQYVGNECSGCIYTNYAFIIKDSEKKDSEEE